ncbi:GNAT domain-containing protein [Bombardia bombarda]|uniref:GNAT domain-containing protein n=1 Tax=Bombardia bombarda TaxID=252184 RepID=A0AA40CF04_9PEZI|nr:GNAT domain-containing protein [Bombardia bombarda]
MKLNESIGEYLLFFPKNIAARFDTSCHDVSIRLTNKPTNTAVSTDKVVLVPYDRRHVLTYHAWMEDPAIQEATASERLTLEAEYENQQSWRESHDKLTFIICHQKHQKQQKPTIAVAVAGEVDSPGRMVGDINIFLNPDDEEEEEKEGIEKVEEKEFACIGEIDIMIANARDRGRGVGRAAVLAFLKYMSQNREGILREYYADYNGAAPAAAGNEEGRRSGSGEGPKLKFKALVAKIKEGNVKSIALFKSLGFEQEGEVNYFGELKFVLHDPFGAGSANITCPDGYAELRYARVEEE